MRRRRRISSMRKETTSRRFEVRLRGAEADAVERALSSEIRFDPDCWIVELELDDCSDLFDLV